MLFPGQRFFLLSRETVSSLHHFPPTSFPSLTKPSIPCGLFDLLILRKEQKSDWNIPNHHHPPSCSPPHTHTSAKSTDTSASLPSPPHCYSTGRVIHFSVGVLLFLQSSQPPWLFIYLPLSCVFEPALCSASFISAFKQPVVLPHALL